MASSKSECTSLALHCVSFIIQGNQKSTQQFETWATMELLVGKVKGSTTGCGNVRNLELSKQCVLCRVTYSVEAHMFIVNILLNQ